jgi:hypothetical protein
VGIGCITAEAALPLIQGRLLLFFHLLLNIRKFPSILVSVGLDHLQDFLDRHILGLKNVYQAGFKQSSNPSHPRSLARIYRSEPLFMPFSPLPPPLLPRHPSAQDRRRGPSSRQTRRAQPPCTRPCRATCRTAGPGGRCRRRTSRGQCCWSIRGAWCRRGRCRCIFAGGARVVGGCAACRP